MIVRKMTASFGVLQNRTLELSSGLNIIEAPNEYGKTTWCAFLRAMLYGIDTAQRGRAGKKPDKVLYAPWSGSPMAGAMELSFGGKDITLSRSTRIPSAPMRVFSAVYSRSVQPVPGLTGENAGETLTGASLPVFERTAFIGPAGLGVQQGAELEKIASLVTTGEESGSFSEAEARLRAMQRKCRYRSSGRLPELEAEMAAVKEKLAAMEETAEELARAEEMAENARIHGASAQKDLADARQKQREDIKYQLETCQAAREKAESEALRREQASAAADEALRAGLLRGAEPDETAAERARTDVRRAKKAEHAARAPGVGLWVWILLVLLAGGFAAAGFYRSVFWFGTLAALLALAVLGIASVVRSHDRADANRVLHEILDRYGAETPEDIPGNFAAYVSQWEETDAFARAAEEEREYARRLAEKELRLHQELAAILGGDTAPQRQITESEKKEQLLREETARLRGRLDTLGDPMVLKSRLRELEAEHERVESEMEALTAALDELALADEEMRSEFSPALAKSAAAALSRLTGGAYTELTLDRELNALVRCAGEPVLHESAFLSRGTADQLYLALRLALCDMLLGGEEPCPIVLDDALINFDDKRMGYALDYLAEIAQHRQILLFSCHSREKRYIQTKNED